MPWWLDNSKLDFPRGYHIEVWGGSGSPAAGFMGGIQRYPPGRRLRRRSQEQYRQLLRHDDRVLGARRDDPERALVCELDPTR
jgi:hypothetical protein